MLKEIKCPGERIYSLLDKLNINGLMEIQKMGNYKGPTDAVDDLNMGLDYPLSELQKRLSQAVKAEFIHNRHVYITFRGYGRNLHSISKCLGDHVQNCRKDGKCLHNYQRWVEEKGKNDDERMMEIDSNTLGLRENW